MPEAEKKGPKECGKRNGISDGIYHRNLADFIPLEIRAKCGVSSLLHRAYQGIERPLIWRFALQKTNLGLSPGYAYGL